MVTYADLLNKLQAMTPEQLAHQVACFSVNTGEVTVMDGLDVAGEEELDEVGPELEQGRPYIWTYYD